MMYFLHVYTCTVYIQSKIPGTSVWLLFVYNPRDATNCSIIGKDREAIFEGIFTLLQSAGMYVMNTLSYKQETLQTGDVLFLSVYFATPEMRRPL